MKEKTSNIKVSIIVPIYNVERYLNECVDSILSQTLREIEVILVDDGSPDNCPKIIDEYARKDSRVVAIHQKNAGYSTAVNRGIDLARGEYIGIIESDDWIEPDMYERLYSNAKENNTDITKGGFFKYNSTEPESKRDVYFKNPSGIDLRSAPNGVFNVAEWPKILAFHASIWSSIYRADFIKKIKIPDTAGASYQDFPFMIETMCRAERITVVKNGFVHWRNDPGQGNSTSAKGKKLLLMAENSKTAVNLVKELGLYNIVKESLIIHVVWANFAFFLNIDKKYKKEYYKALNSILRPVKKDKTFTFEFFQPSDKMFFKLITGKSWFLVKCGLFAAKTRSRFKNFIKKLFPTYRVGTTIKEELDQLLQQNEKLSQDIKDLKGQLKK